MDPTEQTVETLAPLLRSRQLSPVELTDKVLDRIGQLNPKLNAFITVTAESARTAAAKAEAEIAAGDYRGPLHGIPIAHKDIVLTANVLSTGGSKVLAGNVPKTNAEVVDRLAANGAVMLGKLNTYEFACGATAAYGVPVNPWDRERTTGGSSAGSGGALAAGLCCAATGSDTGGSIRAPASFCGVVGLKPTYGRVSRRGVLPLSWSLDHVGPMARTVRGVAALLDAMSGPDPLDPGSRPMPNTSFFATLMNGERAVAGTRIGVPWSMISDLLDAEMTRAFEEALDVFLGLGAAVVPVELPLISLTAFAYQGILFPEATAAHAGWLRRRAHDYAPFTRQKLLLGACLSGTDYLRSHQARNAIAAGLQGVLQDVDALVWPSSFEVAPRLDAPEEPKGIQTRLTNLTGNPSVSIPSGFTGSGLPIGLQISGRLFDEETLLALAAAYEEVTPWTSRRPTGLGDFPPPPASKPYAVPVRPADLSASAFEALEDEVTKALLRERFPIFDEDVEPLALSLHAFRELQRGADEAEFAGHEPLVHQHITNVQPSGRP